MNSNRPKKRLGQHFLRDENIARKIVNSIIAADTDKIIEIGPGYGVLTKYLFEKKGYSILAVEIDHDKVEFLRNKFTGKEARIINKDFLTYDMSEFDNPVALIGNFPYNISSQIFFRILENKNRISEVVCMVQKEVADRLSAGPGTKTYGILSILLQAYYEIEYLFKVSPKVFFPQPKVDSAVIRLTRNSISQLECDEILFSRLVKACFNQRRKTIKNSIQKITTNSLPEVELLQKRPEQLGVAEFVKLTRMVEKVI